MSFPAVRLTLAVAVLVLLVGVALIRLRRVRRAASAREGLTQFLGACAGRYPELLLRQVYAYLAERHLARAAQYQVRPGDDLRQVFGLAGLDVEDAVLIIADRAGARLPRPRELDTVRDRVRTVEELLRFLAPYFRPEVVRE